MIHSLWQKIHEKSIYTVWISGCDFLNFKLDTIPSHNLYSLVFSAIFENVLHEHKIGDVHGKFMHSSDSPPISWFRRVHRPFRLHRANITNAFGCVWLQKENEITELWQHFRFGFVDHIKIQLISNTFQCERSS